MIHYRSCRRKLLGVRGLIRLGIPDVVAHLEKVTRIKASGGQRPTYRLESLDPIESDPLL